MYTTSGDVLDLMKSVKKLKVQADGKTYEPVGGWMNLDGIKTVAASMDGCPVIDESDRFQNIYNKWLKLMKEDTEKNRYNQCSESAPSLIAVSKNLSCQKDL